MAIDIDDEIPCPACGKLLELGHDQNPDTGRVGLMAQCLNMSCLEMYDAEFDDLGVPE